MGHEGRTRRSSSMVQNARSKKGKTGAAAQYMTRNQALKKLQVSLPDFRRLCILKGVYPREPSKKAHGKDKVYYYAKDILWLSHERVLGTFRELYGKVHEAIKADPTSRATEKKKPELTQDLLALRRDVVITDEDGNTKFVCRNKRSKAQRDDRVKQKKAHVLAKIAEEDDESEEDEEDEE